VALPDLDPDGPGRQIERRPTGDQHGAARRRRNQSSFLIGRGGVVEQDQHPAVDASVKDSLGELVCVLALLGALLGALYSRARH
jgi:hypothetical protein